LETKLNQKSKTRNTVFKAAVAFFALLMAVISIFPLVFSFLSSFKKTADIYGDPFMLPKVFSWENYEFAYRYTNILRGMLNSFLYAAISLVIIVFMALCVAFVIRLKVPGHQIIFLYFIAGMTLPVHATLIPLASIINTLKLKGTPLGLVGIYIATNLSLAVFMITGYMKSISKEMDESAIIDGCGPLKLLFRIIAPLTLPAAAAVSIMSFLRIYNDLIFSVLLITKKDLATVSIALMAFKSQYDINYGGTFAGICISIIPMIIFYSIFQRRIQAGLSAGAVKG
jgi:raffinose/stachyose/melibiose transport system permease protein